MLNGGDVSNNQGVIDWTVNPWAFAVIKGTEGTDFQDESLAPNWQGAVARGLVPWTYHFGRPFAPGTSGHAEAEYHLNWVGPQTGGIQVGQGFGALDLEDDTDPTADLYGYAMDYFGVIDRALGYKAPLYSRNGDGYMDRHNLTGHTDLCQHPLWLASPGNPNPAVPKGWQTALFVQRSWSGQVPGINGLVDLDTFNGTVDQLKALGWGNIVPPLAGQPVDPPPTVAVNAQFEATNIGAAALTVSQEALAIYWQLSTIAPTRGDQAAAVMQLKANADAIVRCFGLLGA